MALQKQEVKMTVFGLMCDDCTETIEGCTSESTIRAYAASQGCLIFHPTNNRMDTKWPT